MKEFEFLGVMNARRLAAFPIAGAWLLAACAPAPVIWKTDPDIIDRSLASANSAPTKPLPYCDVAGAPPLLVQSNDARDRHTKLAVEPDAVLVALRDGLKRNGLLNDAARMTCAVTGIEHNLYADGLGFWVPVVTVTLKLSSRSAGERIVDGTANGETFYLTTIDGDKTAAHYSYAGYAALVKALEKTTEKAGR